MGYSTYIIAAVLMLVVAVEKGLGFNVPDVDVGSDWLSHLLATLSASAPCAPVFRAGRNELLVADCLDRPGGFSRGAIYLAGRRAGAASQLAKAGEAELKFQQGASGAKSRILEAGAAPRDRDAR